jgi:hypothetical protein
MRAPRKRSYEQLARVFRDVHGDHNFCTRLAFSVITGKSAGKAIAIAKRYVDGYKERYGLSLSQMRDYFETEFGDDFRIYGGGFGTAEEASKYEGRQFATVARELQAAGGRWVITIANSKSAHAIAIRDGEIVDYTNADSKRKVYAVFQFDGVA